MEEAIFSIDVGATGTKAALVNPNTGELLTDRLKYATPTKATPVEIVELILQLKKDLGFTGNMAGLGFPAIIQDGVAKTANNVNKIFIGYDIETHFSKALNLPVYCLNDADAAGMAELEFGSLKNELGTTILLTLGTGIGSAFFKDGVLVPNTELGSLKYKDSIIEHYVSNSARINKELSWKSWAKELNKVLEYIELIFSPNKIVLGGGISKKFEKYAKYLTPNATIEPAQHYNIAGIIGPAMYAKMRNQKEG